MPSYNANLPSTNRPRYLWSFIAVAGYFLGFAPKPNATHTIGETVTIELDDIEETVTAQGKLEAKEYVDSGINATALESVEIQALYAGVGKSDRRAEQPRRQSIAIGPRSSF